ncbi:Hypothetical predicted protein [Paramuricea clavata]|uniref:Uncharacterized protein n=1 Tax=Paramuricea clavata TaxID=317549 RepID=A0A6S7IFH8_PARCT|nr:Hypothetical predicted protein [Paramuricea clavata]
MEMPRPTTPEEILRLNGMVNYLSRFLPNLSEVMKPVRDLTQRVGVVLVGNTRETWNEKYDIELKYEKGSNMFLADKLSRASIPGDEKSGPEFETINMMKYLPISDERLKEIQRETKSDESLQVLTTVIRQGWRHPTSTSETSRGLDSV